MCANTYLEADLETIKKQELIFDPEFKAVTNPASVV